MAAPGESPTVSVVIPLYNKEKYIAAALQSVVAQTYRDYEVIVVDDGSSDGSVAAVEPFLDRVTLVKQINAGPSVARNRGVELARGRYIAFLDADDCWLPQKLEEQVNYMESHPAVAWSGTNAYLAMFGTQKLPRLLAPEWEKMETGWVTYENWFVASAGRYITQTAAVMVQKQALEEVGLFDPSLPTGQDMDLWIRLARCFPACGFCTTPLVVVNEHTPGCVSLSGEKKYRSMVKYLQKHIHALQGIAKGQEPHYETFIRNRTNMLIRTTLSLGYPCVTRAMLHELPLRWRRPAHLAIWTLSFLPPGFLQWSGTLRRRLLDRALGRG